VIGIDVGGTFTDLFYTGDGERPGRILKVPSTPKDPSAGLVDALVAAGVPPDGLDAILHGTTIATNAVIERKGARCALVTTRGFRDVLELGRRDRPNMYGLEGTHVPLIPRDRRCEVTERLAFDGSVVTPLDEQEVARIGAELHELGVEAVVVAFLHAYANPAHEERARAILAGIGPGWEIVTSAGVVSEYHEVGVGAMLVPRHPGVLCAMGCAIADLRYDGSRTIEERLDRVEQEAIGVILDRQAAEGQARLAASGVPLAATRLAHAADMADAGQIHSLRVPIERSWTPARMAEAFLEAYRAEFGNVLAGIPVMLVNLRTVATGVRPPVAPGPARGPEPGRAGAAPVPVSFRSVHVGARHRTPIFRREDLAPGHGFAGPAVIEQADTTTLVEPGMTLRVDDAGNLIVGAP